MRFNFNKLLGPRFYEVIVSLQLSVYLYTSYWRTEITTKQLIFHKFLQPTSLQQDCKTITEEIDSNKYTDHFCGSFPDIYSILYGFCEI